MNLFIMAQILGALIFILDVFCSLSTNKKKILIYNSIGNFVSMLQYLCLKAYTGVLGLCVTFLRNFLFLKYDKKKKKLPFIWLVILIGLLIVFNYTAYDGLISCIPILTIAIYTIALWQGSITKFKLLDTLIGILSAIYDFHYGAYVSFAAQIIFIIGCVISYIKIKKRIKIKK